MNASLNDHAAEWKEKIDSLRGPILVLGASGFIGANLLHKIAEVRDDVTGTTTHLPAWRLQGLPQRTVRQVDVLVDSELDNLLDTIDPRTVFDCIGYGGYPFETDAKRIYDTNFTFLTRLLPRLSRRGIGAYVHAGTSSEYGTNSAGPGETEFTAPNSDYAVSKIAAAHLIYHFGQRCQLRCANLRLYSVFGPLEDSSRLMPQVVAKGVAGMLPEFVHPEISRDFLYVDDAVAAFLHAALYLEDAHWGESFNIGTGQETTIAAVAEIARELFQIEAQPSYAMPARDWDLSYWFANIDHARLLLRWEPKVTFREGLESVLAWYRGLADQTGYGQNSKRCVAANSIAGNLSSPVMPHAAGSNAANMTDANNQSPSTERRRLAIGMIACERPTLDVHAAIDQLRFGGFDDLVHLFCEPGMPPLRPMARVIEHHNPVRRGVMGNWSYCLRWLLEHTSADYLMVCEDDVEYCRGARDAWERSTSVLSQVGYWSLYTPRRDRELVCKSEGWTASNRGRDTWGTQCMCFPRASAALVLRYDPLHHEDQMRGATDAVVAQCFVDARIPCYYHNPSLANHLGRVSSIGHNWYEDHVGFNFEPEFQAGIPIRPLLNTNDQCT